MQHAIRDYCIENYYDENIREKKISQFSKLLLTTNFAEYDEEFEYSNAKKFLKIHLLKSDQQNQFLMKEIIKQKRQIKNLKSIILIACLSIIYIITKDINNNKITENLIEENILKDFLLDKKSNLVNPIDMRNLKKWIPKPQHPTFSSLKLQLLYKGSQDGFGANIFHKKCNNVTPTISVIKSEYGNKGKIFGGYTAATWEGNGVYKNDSTAFLFSFTNKEKYPQKDDADVIYASPENLINFGRNNDLKLKSNCNSSNQLALSNFPSSFSCMEYSSMSSESATYFSGGHTFKVEEIEVYRVIWE